ncbi:RNA polymerase sigma factor [Neolewinella persica]|uniref:RNA polymerase sigma factor n=1 Tax=Neolewinella persica TaxID=70998 RepID=UPI0003A8B94A|nr:RNA polymerase sigma factor [Neolewinella persica]
MPSQPQQNAFLKWYAPIHDSFIRYCDARCMGIDDPEDMVQEAILSTLEQWDALSEKDRLLAYMIGIVNNRLRNRLRSKAVHRRFVEARKRTLDQRLPARPEAALDLHFLLRAMDELPPTQREALLLQAVSGFSIQEIAKVQQITPGAVKTRISRARKQLKELLAEDGNPLSLRQRLHIYTSILL